MRTLAVLIAATSLAYASPLLAGTPKPAAAHAEAMRKQAQHQQQLYQQEMHRQQQMQKQMAQPQEAYKQQMKAAQQQHSVAKPVAPQVAGTSAHHGSGYRVYRHGNNRSYRHHTRWPTQVDPETAALHHLKSALDGVARGTTANARPSGTLATALGNVVEVDRPPTVAAVRSLAGHLANGMTHRESAGVDTATMALALRAVMNSTILDRDDLRSVMDQHKATLRAAKFQPGDVVAIESAMHAIANQERARR